MTPYRLYIFDPLTGKIDHQRDVVAKDDATAVWISEGLRHTRPMELWHGRSKIHRWDHNRRTSAEPARAGILSLPEPLLSIQ
ncbi:MAG: hypothetical protein ACJ8EL_11190 [Rhizomicrobium sp.]